MPDIKIIKWNYEHNMLGWTKAAVAMCVRKGLITMEQYQEITGETYPD